MDTPAWAARHLHPGERVVWVQDREPSATWTIFGVTVGIGFALSFGGPAIYDMPGPWTWLFERLGSDQWVQAPLWFVVITGSLAFGRMAWWPAVHESLTAWVVTEKRVVRVVRHLSWMTLDWPLQNVTVTKVKRKTAGGGRVRLKTGSRRWCDSTLDLRARADFDGLVKALRPASRVPVQDRD